MKKIKPTSAAALVVAATLAATVGGTAVAAGKPDRVAERSKITVCVTRKLDHLRLVSNRTENCRKNETLLSWSTTGKPGKDGTNGVDGASAYDIAVSYGFVGTEADWLGSLEGAAGADGKDGLSAYDIAVAEGFTGTETDWLDSLEGTDGENGINGADGSNGASAYDIAVGHGFEGTPSEWLASLEGAAGKPGVAGPQGIQGIQGSQGPAGSGISSDAIYDRSSEVPLTPDGRVTAIATCDQGDIVLFPYYSLPSGHSLVEVMDMVSAQEVRFQIGGVTYPEDRVSVRCLDVSGDVGP